MPQEPWLTDDQQSVWRTYLAMNAALLEIIERDMQQMGGMPMAYYLVMAMLSETPEHTLRMTQLALASQMSASRLSHAVARLEEQGWVTRTPDLHDKRGQLATLTEAGYEQLVAVSPTHAETVRHAMFDPLSDVQLNEFGQICRLVLDAIQAG